MKILSVIFVIGVVSGHRYLNLPSEELETEEHGIFPGEKQTTCRCGWANRFNGRIVGGQGTGINQYPWMVSLLNRRKHICGATIITEYHVLTAAHCTVNKTANGLKVVVGGHDTSNYGASGAQLIKVKSIIDHEHYDGEIFLHDISLLELARKIEFSDKIGPACLPANRNEYELIDKYIKVIGWGLIQDKGKLSNTLLQTNLRAIPLEICQKSYAELTDYDDVIDLQTRTQLCTFRKGKDACQGDSGGPVVYLDPETNMYTLVGVVSYGNVCASDTPGVQTEVAAYLDWIQNHLKKSSGRSCTKI